MRASATTIPSGSDPTSVTTKIQAESPNPSSKAPTMTLNSITILPAHLRMPIVEMSEFLYPDRFRPIVLLFLASHSLDLGTRSERPGAHIYLVSTSAQCAYPPSVHFCSVLTSNNSETQQRAEGFPPPGIPAFCPSCRTTQFVLLQHPVFNIHAVISIFVDEFFYRAVLIHFL